MNNRNCSGQPVFSSWHKKWITVGKQRKQILALQLTIKKTINIMTNTSNTVLIINVHKVLTMQLTALV